MPVATIKKQVREGKGSTAALESKWKKAKAEAEKNGMKDNYAYIMSIYNSMTGDKKSGGYGTAAGVALNYLKNSRLQEPETPKSKLGFSKDFKEYAPPERYIYIKGRGSMPLKEYEAEQKSYRDGTKVVSERALSKPMVLASNTKLNSLSSVLPRLDSVRTKLAAAYESSEVGMGQDPYGPGDQRKMFDQGTETTEPIQRSRSWTPNSTMPGAAAPPSPPPAVHKPSPVVQNTAYMHNQFPTGVPGNEPAGPVNMESPDTDNTVTAGLKMSPYDLMTIAGLLLVEDEAFMDKAAGIGSMVLKGGKWVTPGTAARITGGPGGSLSTAAKWMKSKAYGLGKSSAMFGGGAALWSTMEDEDSRERHGALKTFGHKLLSPKTWLYGAGMGVGANAVKGALTKTFSGVSHLTGSSKLKALSRGFSGKFDNSLSRGVNARVGNVLEHFSPGAAAKARKGFTQGVTSFAINPFSGWGLPAMTLGMAGVPGPWSPAVALSMSPRSKAYSWAKGPAWEPFESSYQYNPYRATM